MATHEKVRRAKTTCEPERVLASRMEGHWHLWQRREGRVCGGVGGVIHNEF